MVDHVSSRAAARTQTGRLLRQLDQHLLEVETALLGTGPGPALVRRVELAVDPRSAHTARAFCPETAELWSLPPG